MLASGSYKSFLFLSMLRNRGAFTTSREVNLQSRFDGLSIYDIKSVRFAMTNIWLDSEGLHSLEQPRRSYATKGK